MPTVEEDSAFEHELCHKNELVIGEMKEFSISKDDEDTKLLLVRNEDGDYCAFGNKCTHYGAPLIQGVMKNGRIRCSRHGACFSSKTGDIEDYPGLDSLPKHNVYINKHDKVVVHTTKTALKTEKRIKTMKTAMKNDVKVVIIGGGASALTCSESLRQQGFCGQIIVVNKSNLLPYDRPIMTKDLSAKIDDILMRSKDFYNNFGIVLKLGTEVVNINAHEKIIECKNKDEISYDKLLISTGLTVRKLDIPGSNLKNVFVIGTPSDCNIAAERARGKRVLVIGASFTGMEVVCFLRQVCKEITVCCRKSVPFEQAFGKEVGAGLQKLHENRGVKFHTKNGVVKIVGKDVVEGVILENGLLVEVDVVVAGVGATLNTGFLKSSSLQIDREGFIVVNKYLQTNLPDVYAAGAAVRFPLRYYGGKLVNVEHWQMAHYHGKIAGLNMSASVQEPETNFQNFHLVDSIPFFYTEQYGMEIQYAGYGEDHDEVMIHGDIANGKFSAFLFQGK
ncbi:apoptosis-inducing factor 3-like [Styela clava]